MSLKSLILVLVQAICSVYIVFSGGIIPKNVYSIIILASGLLLGIWAMLEFRFRFNIFPELLNDSVLVTSGPYRFIRHPIYTAVLLITLAYVTNHFTYINLSLWVVLLIVLNVKLRYEEKFLMERFKEYGEYRSRTKTLVPFVI